LYKIIEPLVKFRGRPFKYRLLFPIIVVGISAIVAFLYANAKYVHYTLGNALYRKGQYDAAIAEFKEAIWLKAQPHQGPLQLGRGSQKVR
jgi:tetratricopeptide (TPR) repeat protein